MKIEVSRFGFLGGLSIILTFLVNRLFSNFGF